MNRNARLNLMAALAPLPEPNNENRDSSGDELHGFEVVLDMLNLFHSPVCDYIGEFIASVEEAEAIQRVVDLYLTISDRSAPLGPDIDEAIMADEDYQDLMEAVRQAREMVARNP